MLLVCGLAVTLTFDFLTTKCDQFIFVPKGPQTVHFVHLATSAISDFIRYSVLTKTITRTHERTDSPKTELCFRHSSNGGGGIKQFFLRTFDHIL